MAKSRCIPTALMSDPDYMELDSDAQVILLMLVLTADDEGRGHAHTGMLSRHFNKSAETIEQALATLAELDLVTCYVVGRHRYYQLLRWWEWQTLSKPTPSRFPQPPASCEPETPSAIPPRETQETPGEYRLEGEGEGKGKRREQNYEAKAKETDVPPGTTRFPRPPTASAAADVFAVFSSKVSPEQRTNDSVSAHPSVPSELPIQHIAEILRLPVTEPLMHLVSEYAPSGSLAILRHATAAREWIDDRTRNRYNTSMTVTFFRNWLKREQEWIAQNPIEEQSSSAQHADNTTRVSDKSWRGESQYRQEPRFPSLMHLAKEDAHARRAIG